MKWNISNVMVPLDGSDSSDAALLLALPIIKPMHARLHLVHVQDMPDMPQAVEQAQAYVAAVAKRAATRLGPDAVISTVLSDQIGGVAFPFPPRSAVADILGRYALENDIELIVMATHGRGGVNRAWLGSVADALVRHARVPVLLYPAANGPATAFQMQRILIPLDGSERAERIIAPAVGLGTKHNAHYTLLSAVAFFSLPAGVHPIAFNAAKAEVLAKDRADAERYLNAQAARLLGEGHAVSTEVIEASDVAHAVVRFAREGGHDAIAISTRGLGGGRRLLLGSVADKVIRSAELPVLVLNTGRDSDAATKDT